MRRRRRTNVWIEACIFALDCSFSRKSDSSFCEAGDGSRGRGVRRAQATCGCSPKGARRASAGRRESGGKRGRGRMDLGRLVEAGCGGGRHDGSERARGWVWVLVRSPGGMTRPGVAQADARRQVQPASLAELSQPTHALSFPSERPPRLSRHVVRPQALSSSPARSPLARWFQPVPLALHPAGRS